MTPNLTQQLQAAKTGVALYRCDSWGLMELTGRDRQRFLHNQTTNNLERLQTNQGCSTVFVNSTGRTLELASAYLSAEAILVLVSPGQNQPLLAWMDRYLFPMDKVNLQDLTGKVTILRLIGSQSPTLLQNLGLEIPLSTPLYQHFLLNLGGYPVRVAVGDGLGLGGYTLFLEPENAAAILEILYQGGAIPLDGQAWEILRIEQGYPLPGAELTEDYNPLEAGLWSAISFEKGCYIGQETIARLNTYKGVKQRLWGLKLEQGVEVGTPLILAGEKVGILTSITHNHPEGYRGLGYLRTKAGGEGLEVSVGETRAQVYALPLLSHDYFHQPRPKGTGIDQTNVVDVRGE
jgi:folate-binding protein YgfZ